MACWFWRGISSRSGMTVPSGSRLRSWVPWRGSSGIGADGGKYTSCLLRALNATSASSAPRPDQPHGRFGLPWPRAPPFWRSRYLLGFVFRGDVHLAVGVGGLILDGFMLLTLAPLYHQHRLGPRDLGLRPTAPARAVGPRRARSDRRRPHQRAVAPGRSRQTRPGAGGTLHVDTVQEILIGVQLAVTAPIVEEIFFWGLLYRALRNRLSILPAALIAGFVFGAVHGVAYPLNTLPPRMVFGGGARRSYSAAWQPRTSNG